MLDSDKNNSVKKESRRVSMTRRLIKESLIELLKEKALCEISIREICENADVNRSTFYAHYENASSVLIDIERDFVNRMPFIPNGTSPKYQRIAINQYLRYIEENRHAFLALHDNGFLDRAIAAVALKKSDDIFISGVQAPELYQLIVCQVNAGTNQMIRRWLEHGGFTSEEIAEIIIATLPSPKKAYDAWIQLRKGK